MIQTVVKPKTGSSLGKEGATGEKIARSLQFAKITIYYGYNNRLII